MSIRCANCGSTRVCETTKNEGFSVGKAVAGTILFGPIGAVMGTDGKSKKYYHCSTCGVDMDHLMSDFFATHIDNLLSDPKGNAELLASTQKTYFGIEYNNTSLPSTQPLSSKNANMRLLIKNHLNPGHITNEMDLSESIEKTMGDFIDFRKFSDAIKEMYTEGEIVFVFKNNERYVQYISDKGSQHHYSLLAKWQEIYKNINLWSFILREYLQCIISFNSNQVSIKDFANKMEQILLEKGWSDNGTTSYYITNRLLYETEIYLTFLRIDNNNIIVETQELNDYYNKFFAEEGHYEPMISEFVPSSLSYGETRQIRDMFVRGNIFKVLLNGQKRTNVQIMYGNDYMGLLGPGAQLLSPILKKMVQEGKLTETIIGKTKYYSSSAI